MILVLLVFFYSFLICLGMAYALPYRSKNLALHLTFGLFVEMLLLHFWLIFLPASLWFYAFNFLVSLVFIGINFKEVKLLFYHAYWDFARIPILYRAVIFAYALLVLMQSSVAPYLIDNESYYLQTIRWLNDFGLVKGLANLHIYLGQMSGWHVLQSGFNFGFAYQLFNDVNGFLMLLFVVFAAIEFHKKDNTVLSRNLLLGVFIFSPFLFQFVSVPSPDLAVYLLAPIVVYNYLNQKPLLELLIPCLIITLAKITAFPILIFPAIVFFKDFKVKKLGLLFILSLLSLAAFCIKNYLVSGYALYPLNIQLIENDWAIPAHVQEFYYRYTKMHAFLTTDWETFEQFSYFERLKLWLTSPKLHGLFNAFVVVLMLLFPILGRFNKQWKSIYFFGFVQLFLLLITSPQYRFFFHLIMLFSLVIFFYQFKSKLKKLKALLFICAFSPIIFLAIPIDVAALTNNDFMKTGLKTFRSDYIFKPHKNSQYDYPYKKIKEGNLILTTPINTHFWLTGDGTPPILNEIHMNHFKETLNVVPQLRDSTSIHQGFFSKEVKTE